MSFQDIYFKEKHWITVPKNEAYLSGLCRLFSNLVDVSHLDGKRDFMLFEDGIEPDWDDPGNEKGGLWLAHTSDMALNTVGEDGSLISLHTVWLDTVRIPSFT